MLYTCVKWHIIILAQRICWRVERRAQRMGEIVMSERARRDKFTTEGAFLGDASNTDIPS